MIGPIMFDYLADVWRLIETVTTKRNRKGPKPCAGCLSGIVEDRRGVHPPAEPDSERHIGHKMLANRMVQEIIEFSFCIFERLRCGLDIRNTPICVLVRAAVLPFEPVAWRQLFNSIY